jgi:hypothetical protein
MHLFGRIYLDELTYLSLVVSEFELACDMDFVKYIYSHIGGLLHELYQSN